MAAQQTIVAVATPPGRGAIAIVRASGPAVPDLVAATCSHPEKVESRRVSLQMICDSAGAPIDQCLVLYFQGPNSYTGEDLVEFHLHGNPVIAGQLVCALEASGASLAGPGAFTRRAILNGRMGLPEAEALADLIDAASPAGVTKALAALGGSLRDWAEAMRHELVDLLAQLEAAIDFPDEPITPQTGQQLVQRLVSVATELRSQAERAGAGRIWTHGATIVLAGAPNVGKSTLMNCLTGKDRAIVSDQPGTTRDFLESTTRINDLPVRLIDTAGLRDIADPIEADGIRRTEQQAASADVVVLVAAPDAPAVDVKTDAPVIRVWNKVDIQSAPNDRELPVSGLHGTGIDQLRARIVAACPPPDDDTVVQTLRQEADCRQAAAHLDGAAGRLAGGEPAEIVAEDVRLAVRAMEQLLGLVDSEQVLDRIFSSFCIGK